MADQTGQETKALKPNKKVPKTKMVQQGLPSYFAKQKQKQKPKQRHIALNTTVTEFAPYTMSE